GVPADLIDRRKEIDADLRPPHPEVARRRQTVSAVVPPPGHDDDFFPRHRAIGRFNLIDQSPGGVLHEKERRNAELGGRPAVQRLHLLGGDDLHFKIGLLSQTYGVHFWGPCSRTWAIE